MHVSPDTLAILMAMEVPADQKVALLKAMERDWQAYAPPSALNGTTEERERIRNESTYAERKRAKDRERQRLIREEHRKSRDVAAMSRDVDGESTATEGDSTATASEAAPPSLPSSPQTPQQPTHPPGDINTRVKPAFGKSNGFARFWEAYPNKVGKAAAEKSYGRALGKIGGPDPPAVLLAGVERAKASREWREGFIPHPTTWLNQGRWDDEPAEIPHPEPRKAHERSYPDQRQTPREDRLSRMLRGAMAAVDEREPGVG